MKFIKFLTVIICLLVYVNTLTALEVGEKAPPLDISKWINGPPVSINKTDKKVYVVFFWATWSNISPNLMNYVSRENFIFADDGVVFVGISKESPKRIKDFLKDFNTEKINTHIYNDTSVEKGILNFANEINANLIGMGTHGRKGISHFFNGSISEDLVNHANMPVMTFKI